MSLYPKYGSVSLDSQGRDSESLQVVYPKTYVAEEHKLLVGQPSLVPDKVNVVLAEIIFKLFATKHHHSHNHPRSTPYLPPQKRYSRHRNFWVYQTNEFRHWWKTSRLLVRLAGAWCFARVQLNWHLMTLWDVTKRSQLKRAAKQEKLIGQGGVAAGFLNDVQPFTRVLRIVLALCRAWEARVDNRFYEVGIAEFFAFIGNHLFRFWARKGTDYVTRYYVLPVSGVMIQPYLSTHNRPVIVLFGIIRALLPFAMSFQGARLGRQMTYNTYRNANYRWKPIMSIMHFHERAGTYQPIETDPHLLALARQVAEAIGHGADPEETRIKLASIGFHVFGSGCGGYSVYRKIEGKCKVLLNCTPYGPSILDEMPRFILLERRTHFYMDHLKDLCDATILDAATPRDAKIRGYTYSGAFFSHQEWAALKNRFDDELLSYSEACRIHGTHSLPVHKRNPMETKQPAPPTDLVSLKAFIRSGRRTFQQWVDDRRWKEVQREVGKMAKLISKYQKNGKAPSRVILYLEGLDCAGKSSTGMLICNALQKSGYDVNVAQHNRPPTAEQQAKPWMDRSRFEYPEDMFEYQEDCPDYASLVWDRGPVGDFVYGNMNELGFAEKMKRYKEFREYDYSCRHNDVLFFKCFFVTDKDKIASTLGKRLAQKKIAQELNVWLDANSSAHAREGLQEIMAHIDPTDFIAYNNYEENMRKFCTVVRNTDIVGHVCGQAESVIHYRNPWLVINTSNRHAARLSMMQHFRGKLKEFAVPLGEDEQKNPKQSVLMRLFGRGNREETAGLLDNFEARFIPDDIVDVTERGLPPRVFVQSFLLLVLLLIYAHQSWNFNLEDLT